MDVVRSSPAVAGAPEATGGASSGRGCRAGTAEAGLGGRRRDQGRAPSRPSSWTPSALISHVTSSVPGRWLNDSSAPVSRWTRSGSGAAVSAGRDIRALMGDEP